jgi:preprotein translocase subunit SecG
MIILLLAIHIMVAVALVGVVLLQKSEGGALGMGGGGMSGFMTGRSTANLLTRATAILAAAFMTTSVLLVVLHNRERAPVSILDQGAPGAPVKPAVPLGPTAPLAPAAPSAPAQPAMPTAPLAH